MTHSIAKALVALALTTATLVVSAPASNAASASTHHYSSCAAVHRVYSGGIAKAGVKYNTVRHTEHRALRGHVKFSTALYNANRTLDRDHDGIACELS